MLDWTLAEMALSLNLVPVALTEVAGYRAWVGEPLLPTDVVELGLRGNPNLEMLVQIAPDLILANENQEASISLLPQIAPCLSASIYAVTGSPYMHAASELRRLGGRLDRISEAEAAIATSDRAIARAAEQVAGFSCPVYLARFVDPDHLMIFGRNSLFQDVLDRMGVANAWQGATSAWGFGIVGIDALVCEKEAHLLYLGLGAQDLEQIAATSAVWRSLAFVRQKRISILPSMWFFGGVASAGRFADHAGMALAESK
ncbi:ABC transporter substrate-binding protein [Rhizobium lusitanum]|uniref:ABC transporter substrate-binding protein n=1 Tax=Rhizobium lusitanum TaxID=293958 RepID=A0A6L9UK80_9HYPH|nr:ABC transporter substrate-binding protein [Rhizobium lusitanum]